MTPLFYAPNYFSRYEAPRECSSDRDDELVTVQHGNLSIEDSKRIGDALARTPIKHI